MTGEQIKEKVLALLYECRARGAKPEEMVRELLAAAFGVVSTAPAADRRFALNAIEQAVRFYLDQVKKEWGM